MFGISAIDILNFDNSQLLKIRDTQYRGPARNSFQCYGETINIWGDMVPLRHLPKPNCSFHQPQSLIWRWDCIISPTCAISWVCNPHCGCSRFADTYWLCYGILWSTVTTRWEIRLRAAHLLIRIPLVSCISNVLSTRLLRGITLGSPNF